MSVNIQRIKEMSASEAKDALVRARSAVARARAESKRITERAMVAVAGTAGAAVAGALEAWDMTEVADVPVPAAGGVAAEMAGILGMGGSDVADFSLICFGVGLSSPEVAKRTANALR